MKKITLAFALLTGAIQAQNFPSPYCSIPTTSVEPITLVSFNDVIITNTNSTSILIDRTDTEIILVPGSTYTLTVEGDTRGNFDTSIVAFIDWNKNEILNDPGEVYAVGILSNSNGSDGTSVSLDITVPADAVLQTTRIRITKIYQDDYTLAVVDPCAISMEIPDYGTFPGYGQALDFAVYPGFLGIDSFEVNALSAYPIPTKDILNVEYKSMLNAVKIYNLLGQEVYSMNTASSKLAVDISYLSAGAYIVKLFAAEGQHSFKMIKQ